MKNELISGITYRTAWFEEREEEEEGEGLLTIQAGRKLFSNVEEIFRVNSAVLDSLKEISGRYGKGDKTYATVFADMAPYLNQYLMYYINYDEANETLESLMEESPDFR